MAGELTERVREQLNHVSTPTLTSQLQQRGIRSTFLSGLRPIKEGQRMLGYAHTLRYVPVREDLQAQFGGRQNAQRRAVESLAADEVLVIEARGEPDAGTIGDIYVSRAIALGATGIVTDGALRDTPAIKELGIAVYHRASHAATFGRLHMALDHQIPIACAGVTVLPGDIVVGDGEGAVIVPAALVEEVAGAAYQQELEEEWALGRVAAGESTVDVFPIASERRSEFESWLAGREEGSAS
jgi:regulator of RNase E activity RraA